MQQDINQIISYFSDWQLKVNPSKCELLHLGVRNQRYNYSIDGEQVPKVNNCRDIGVKVSDDYKFSLHVTEIVRNAYHRLRQIRICFSCHDVDFRLHMYNIYVRPVLEYITVIWSPHLLKNIDKIEGVQRLFTRTLAGMSNLTYDQRLQRLKLKSLEERRIVNDLIFVFKIIRGLVKLDVNDFFEYNSTNTRGHNSKLRVQYSRVNYRKFFFSNRVIPIWNALPQSVVESSSLNDLKKGLDQIDFRAFCRGRAIMTR